MYTNEIKRSNYNYKNAHKYLTLLGG